MSQNRFKITMKENGVHSFKKGIDAYEEYQEVGDQMLLKDAFIHSVRPTDGAKLMAKRIIVDTNTPVSFSQGYKVLWHRMEHEIRDGKIQPLAVDTLPASRLC